MPRTSVMLRRSVFTIALALTAATAALAQLPPQPPPVDQGTDQERAACHPDVMRYCREVVEHDESDVFAILGCLQTHRPRISVACRTVLANHGQ